MSAREADQLAQAMTDTFDGDEVVAEWAQTVRELGAEVAENDGIVKVWRRRTYEEEARANIAEAEVERLRETMRRCAEKLRVFGNDEPLAVADVLAREASSGSRDRT